MTALVLAGSGSDDLSEFLETCGFIPHLCRDPNGQESEDVSAEERINFFTANFPQSSSYRAAVIHLDDLDIDRELRHQVIQAALDSGKPVLFVTGCERHKSEIRSLLEDKVITEWDGAPQIYLEPLTFMIDVAIKLRDTAPRFA